MRFVVAGLRWKEIVAVAYGLNEYERAIKQQGYEPRKDELRRAEVRPWRGCCDVRQNERENRERRQHGQSSARAMDLKSLFVVTGTTPQQA